MQYKNWRIRKAGNYIFGALSNLLIITIYVFCRVKKHQVMFIPSVSGQGANYGYDNFTSDNVLCILRAYLNHEISINYKTIYISSFNADTGLKLHNRNITLVTNFTGEPSLVKRKILSLYYHYLIATSKVVISSSPLEPLKYKNKHQIHIALNYYSIPFKNDYNFYSLNKNTIDYVIATSQLGACIDSSATNLPVKKYLVTGFPRNDYIVKPRYTRHEILNCLNVGNLSSKIVVYAPTHRDGLAFQDAQENIIFGVRNLVYVNELLRKHNAFLLIKHHPVTMNLIKSSVKNSAFERVLMPASSKKYTLYDVLPHADLLITDYSSLYFDFLLTDKPIIFNFIDKESYESARGFSIDPIEAICAGRIVYTENEFRSGLEMYLSDKLKNDYISNGKRQLITAITNKFSDGYSTNRVMEFLVKNVFTVS